MQPWLAALNDADALQAAEPVQLGTGLCPLNPCAGFTHNPIHNNSALLLFLPNPPLPYSASISSCTPAGAVAGGGPPGGLLPTKLGHPAMTMSSPLGRVEGHWAGRGRDQLLSPWEICLNPVWMGPRDAQGHANSRFHARVGDPYLCWLPFCLQYMLSQETIEALRKPTFDVWLWEPNEVRLPRWLG